MPVTPPSDPSVAIAVLFERLGHVMEKVDALSVKLDRQDERRTAALLELETRVESIEAQVNGFRYFLAGVAAAGGALGGTIASAVARMF